MIVLPSYSWIYNALVEKVMISLPEELLSAVDAAAAARAISRSHLVREALRAHLSAAPAAGRAEAFALLRRSLGGGGWTAEELVRAERHR